MYYLNMEENTEDFKYIFRNHLIDTKNSSNILTIFDNKRHNSLLGITESILPFGPDEYLRAWMIQGDEKYNNIDIPKEEFIYTFQNTLFWIVRYHAINTDNLIPDWKDSQLWKIIVVDNNNIFEYPIVSSLVGDHRVFVNLPNFIQLEIKNKFTLRIKNNKLTWNNKTWDLVFSPNFKKTRDNISSQRDLLKFHKISQPLDGGMLQHFIWTYENDIFHSIARLYSIMSGFQKTNKLLNVIEFQNGNPITVNIRNTNIEIPYLQFKGSQHSMEVYQTKNKENWCWILYTDQESINHKSLFGPLEAPEGVFDRYNIDITPLVLFLVLSFILVILVVLFITYPYFQTLLPHVG